MKKAFLAGASIAATLIGAPALAATGFIGLEYGGADTGIGGGKQVESWGASGAVDLNLDSYVGVQIDAGALSNSGNTSSNYTASYVAGHVYHRYGANQFGLVVGAGSIDTTKKVTPWDVGLEFQHHASNSTFTLSGNYFDADDAGRGLAVDGSIRGYLSDHFALGANVGWLNTGNSKAPHADTDALLWGVNAEVQIASSPFSAYVAYDSLDAQDSAAQSQRASVGVRYSFGVGTLKERDDKGPSLLSQSRIIGGLGIL